MVSTVLKRSLRPFVFQTDVSADIGSVVPRLGLYIHVPFCRSICSFCPYFKVKYQEHLVEPFVDALRKEIGDAARAQTADPTRRQRVTSLYFGGGTPALLLRYLPGIIGSVNDAFHVEGPCGIELHPDDVTPATLHDLRAAGVTMVSLGVQSFHSHCLSALGRRDADMRDRITLARDRGFTVVDVDLIFGIPGQTPADILDDFRIAVAAGATQVSTYPFIDFSYANNPRKPAGRRAKRRMLEAILEVCEGTGFERTSVWTFATKGSGRYSSVTRDNYLGFGPGAASLLPESFSLNVFSVPEYIRAVSTGTGPTAYVAALDSRERALFWLFWHTYNLTLERSVFAELFNADLDDWFGTELRAAAQLGLVAPFSDGYRITTRGAYLFHLVEQLYTNQYIDRIWSLASGTPWPRKLVIW